MTIGAQRHLVLVGGGHAHALVLLALGMQREADLAVTIVAKETAAPYSGMLPGFVAGHYTREEIHIDVVRLANWMGARVIHGAVTGVDRVARRVIVEGHGTLGYDLLSIDVGITPRLDAIKGAAEHGIPVKPVSSFSDRWQRLEAAALSAGGPRRFVVVGTGAAGFELVLAIRQRLLNAARRMGIETGAYSFALVGGGRLLPSHNGMARMLASRAIVASGVRLLEDARVAEVGTDFVRMVDGRELAADAVLLATDAGPAAWFVTSGLPVDARGFLSVRPSLQLVDDDDVFAVGDCASVVGYPREKAGVFAVRQGPPLTDNLRRRVRGEAAVPFRPQKRFLTLLSLGGRRAIAARNGLAVAGEWVWRWKDNIDRAFMERFVDLPRGGSMGGAGAFSDDETMPCAGCGAKVGPRALTAALDRSGSVAGRDDAAIRDTGAEMLEVESVDFLSAFWPEPALFGEIAAQHAMSDIYAMGGVPARVLATAVVPYGSASRTQEDLTQLLTGARRAFGAAGVALVGGHSGVGPQLAAGFYVSGRVPRARVLRKAGVQAGDALVLTRPIGSGVLFAALMRNEAAGDEIMAALSVMRRSQARAAGVLAAHGAHGMTDVTGFGLIGHLLEMLAAGGLTAEVDLGSVPLYRGALRLARSGIASSLMPENVCTAPDVAGAALSDPAVQALLFDPQTAGGLLAGVPSSHLSECLAALAGCGEVASARIGAVLAAVGEGGVRIKLVGTLPHA